MTTSAPRGVDWDAEPLGFEPDCVLAFKHDVTTSAVRLARRVRGIPECDGRRAMIKLAPDVELELMRAFGTAPMHVAIHMVLREWMEGRTR